MAVIAKQRYKLDITPQGGWVIIYASQHDDEAREIEFEIVNQGKVFSIPASINVSVQGIKSNGGYFSHSCSYSGNIVTMVLADDMTDVIGKAICVLKFTNQSNQKLATAKFVLNVDTDASSEGVIIDTEAEEIFNQMLNDIRAQAASVSADIAELQSMVGSPLVASTVSAMTDHNKIYVYVGSESGYTNGNWYYWNGSAWTSGGVYNSVAISIDSVPTQGSNNAVSSGGVYNALDTLQAQIPQIDTTLTQEGQAADAKETGNEITGLKEDLNIKIDADGEHQVTPQNIEGMQYTKTTVEVEGENIFNESMLFEEGYYVSILNGKIAHTTSTAFNAYCIPVTKNTKYRFTQARFCALAKGNALGADAVGTLEQNLTEIETGEAVYMFLTISNAATNISVKEMAETSTYTDFVLPDWLKTDTSELESGLESIESEKVDKNGTWQVKPQNIDGVTVSGGNVLEDAERIYCSQPGYVGGGGYVTISNSKAVIANSANFCSFLIPVKSNTHYTANNPIRFAVLLKDLNTSGTSPVMYSTVVGSALANISSFDTGEADHIIVSWAYTTYPVDSFIISEGNTPTTEKTITLPDWWTGGSTPTVVEKPKYASITGSLSSGGSLILPLTKNNLRKGERVVFEGNITSFDSLKIGLVHTAPVTDSIGQNVFLIDGTNISYYSRLTNTPVTVPHGMTITDNVQIIWEMTAVATCKITLISDGNIFSHEFSSFVRQTVGFPFVLSVGTVLIDCKLTWTCTDLCKNIWMFGDSYFAYSEARWPYYLHQYGYDQNCLFDGFPGEGSVNGKVAFNNLLQYGTPKFAVWCLGMNDTTDSESAPATNWVTNRDLFLQYCQNNDVTPIFGTIPTVPAINHEQKNTWIRSSGYRYIDFAKAVGASASGVWFSGMLSSDNVHPTPQGARALFARVLLDLPEIMVDDWR